MPPTRPLRLLLATLLLCWVAAPAAEPRSLLGEWRLVEQTYGQGRSNLVTDDAPPVLLEFHRQGPRIQGTIRAGQHDAEGLSWPRLTADTSRTIHVEEQQFSVEGNRVRTRYRVDPSPGDDLVLVVTEEYAVVEDGQALAGTVRVEFRRGGEERGSYLLHRRFERER